MAIEDKAKIRVLVVEDHHITMAGIQAQLSQEQDFLVVGGAVDSATGLTIAKQEAPDVVLLDLHLPGELGPSALVKAFCQLPNMKVIVLSAEDRMAFVEAVVEAGACGFLLKSELPENISNAVRKVFHEDAFVTSPELVKKGQKLSVTEKQLLKMIAQGLKYEDMAELRRTTRSTVRKQLIMLMEKLEVYTREQLIAWAVENGFSGVEIDRR